MAGEKQLRFSRVQREPRLADKVAGMLLESITGHGLRPGDKLPSERELGEQFGVSRTVIREAVRAVAAKGIIEVRTGSGLRVAAVDASMVSEAMNLFLRGHESLDYDKIHEVRAMLELQIAEFAAERATDADIEHLTEACEELGAVLDDPERASRADVAFHRAVAEATHNELYLVILDALGDVLLDIRRATLHLDGRPRQTLLAHRSILERIAARDGEGAREAMRDHLQESQQAWAEADPPG